LKSLPQSDSDEEGVFVMGYRLAPDSGSQFSDIKIRTCPIADINRLAPVIQTYNRFKAGLVQIKDVYPAPTVALIDCLDVIDYNVNEAHRRATERAMKEAKNG
jgi:hypothetical protein